MTYDVMEALVSKQSNVSACVTPLFITCLKLSQALVLTRLDEARVQRRWQATCTTDSEVPAHYPLRQSGYTTDTCPTRLQDAGTT